MPIQLMLVDRHQILCDGLRALLGQYPEFEVVAEADNGLDALELAEALPPSIVVTDLALPRLNGIELTRCITAQWPEVRVLILSTHRERRLLSAALTAGAAGYVVKMAGIDELVEALRVLARSQSYLSPHIAGTVIDELVRRASADAAPYATPLTARAGGVAAILRAPRTPASGRIDHVNTPAVGADQPCRC